jgi:hypothetical protein
MGRLPSLLCSSMCLRAFALCLAVGGVPPQFADPSHPASAAFAAAKAAGQEGELLAGQALPLHLREGEVYASEFPTVAGNADALLQPPRSDGGSSSGSGSGSAGSGSGTNQR